MRAWLPICAIALTACAAEPEAEAQTDSLAIVTTDEGVLTQQAEIVTEVDSLLDGLESAKSNYQSESTEGNLREYWAIRNQLENAGLSENQQARFDALITEYGMEVRRANPQAPESLPAAYNQSQTQLTCKGIVKQGGLVVCQTIPNARVEVGRSKNDTYTQTADKDGVLLVGFDRDEPAAFVRVGNERVDFDITPREYDTSRIDGLPKNMVSEYTAEELKKIRKASALKKVGFASKVEEVGFKDGFIFPVADYIKTTNFGAQRILNGDPKRPHFGVDLAAPKGTPIVAPADGIVSLASEEMYFEGSLIMIDHGQGLISYYLHNEDVTVQEGQHVKQGEQIGTVGSRGRSTGPHLCWRLKWRGRNLDPELLTEWPQSG